MLGESLMGDINALLGRLWLEHAVYTLKIQYLPCWHAGGSSGAEAEPKEEGMWLALSQIQEWVVEFGCDMLFISFRTDVAWYRLSK